jgi:hypothetical protein
MNELIPLVSSLGGALIASAVGLLATRISKRHEWKLALAKDQAAARQTVYAAFLVECQRLVLRSIDEKLSSTSGFEVVTGKFAEVSLVGGDEVVIAAQAMVDHVVSRHAVHNKAASDNFFALQSEFVASARKDIASILDGK